jgi:hypothetical protein
LARPRFRIPVTVILEHIAEEEPWEKILENYPELTNEDIQAALLYARASLEHTDLKALNAKVIFVSGAGVTKDVEKGKKIICEE